jgi:VanZ family protein
MNLTARDLTRALRRAWFAIGWMGVAALIYFSLTPEPPRLDVEQGDKLQHLAAYGTLMLWFEQVFVNRTQRLWVAIALVALGVGLEFAQLLLTAYRTFSFADMIAGAVGVVVAWMSAPPRSPNLLSIAERITASRIAAGRQPGN